jgi:drug/metabolite transporter (DMT)-like permease
VNKDDANTLIGLIATLIGVFLLVIGWGERDMQIFTLLGAVMLFVAFIYVVTSKGFRTRPWRDWFPF